MSPLNRSEHVQALLRLSAKDPFGALAVAVVEIAVREAVRGDAEARRWLDQVRADVLEDGPGRLARRVA